ncbi:hypothetical protein DNTS_024580 [Danionella cerebrum]|uniref:CENP-T/Histone H4 histone fold domain-containing protein n=1 Tax=Danionella cerebrum TaxID=2873325 RepID=A0A553NHI2_9TELE|nr:hypothetical protein DNTS_024580 [Danionella translucida]
MDLSEDDISARILLKKVLHTELPRSPVNRGATQSVRRSTRMKNTPGLENPGSALRHRLKKKLQESASVSPLPSPKRRRSAKGMEAASTVPPSPLNDEDITTRGLLRGIIQMETEASLLISAQPAPHSAEHNPADASGSSVGEQTEGLSGTELSDLSLSTEPLTHVVRGLSRKRTQKAFSVSAKCSYFSGNTEEVLPDSLGAEDFQGKPDTSHDWDSSAGSKSGLNLTLKTPFVDMRTVRAGLQRKVSNRRLPSIEAFDEAVERCLQQNPDQDLSELQHGTTLEESSWQKLPLDLSDITDLHTQGKKEDQLEPNVVLEIQNETQVRGTPQQDVNDVMEVPSQDEDDVIAGSLESRGECDLVLAQEFLQPLPENVGSEDVEETEDEVEDYPERITRRAHHSEGRGAVIQTVPGSGRVTKSFGAGLNPREKDGVHKRSLEMPDNEKQIPGSSTPPLLCLSPDISTHQHQSCNHREGEALAGEENQTEKERCEMLSPEMMEAEEVEVQSTDEDEEIKGSEADSQILKLDEDEDEDDIKGPETTNKSIEPPQEDKEDKEVSESEDVEIVESDAANQRSENPEEDEEEPIESEAANQSFESLQENEIDEGEVVESDTANQRTEPPEEEEEEQIESEAAIQSFQPLQEDEVDEEEVAESEAANQKAEHPEEEDIMESETANQSVEPAEEEEEDEVVPEDEDEVESLIASQSPEQVEEEEEEEQEMIEAEPANQSSEHLQEDEEDDDDEEDAHSAEYIKLYYLSPTPQVRNRAPRMKRQTGNNVLPKSYVMSIFKHFAKTKVASDVYPVINEILEKYFNRLADDLEAYATHAKRKTIEVEDFELLMRRQGFVTDRTPVNVLIEKYLPLEYRKLLIPVATSGNKVIPTQRR